MEYLQAPGKWFRDEKLIFRLAVGAGLLISLFSIVFIHDMYRDSAGVYAYAARELAAGNFAEGWESRVPMLNILLSAGLSVCGLEAFRATVVISCLFYWLTVFPLRRFLEQFLTPLQAAWGCLFFVTAPKIIRYSVSGLIDSSRYFFLIAALYLLFKLREKTKYGDAVLFGLTLAGLSVSRGEELVFAVGLWLALILLPLLKSPGTFRSELKPRLAALLLAGAVFLLGIAPFCAVNAHYTGFFITDVRIAQAVLPAPPAEKRPPARKFWNSHRAQTTQGRLREVAYDTSRGAYEPFGILALIGTLALLIKRRWRWEYTLLWGLYLVHAGLYFKVGSTYRYHIYLIPLFMPFTITGLLFFLDVYELLKLPEKLRNAVTWAAAAGLLVLLGGQVLNGLQCVTDRKDVWIKEVAGIIREWGRTHVPGRKVRVAATGLPVAVYWSEGFPVFGYKRGPGSLKETTDFDLLLINENLLDEIAGRTDLEPVPVPDRKNVEKDPGKRYLLFALKKPEKGGRK